MQRGEVRESKTLGEHQGNLIMGRPLGHEKAGRRAGLERAQFRLQTTRRDLSSHDEFLLLAAVRA